MKKYISILILSCFLLATQETQAQRKAITFLSSDNNALDTLDNTATLYLTVASSANISGRWSTGTIIAEGLEISGDGSGAVLTLQIKANGKWADAPVQYTADTAWTMANVTTAQTYAWRVFNLACEGLRIKCVGAGTMSYKVSATGYLAN